MAQNDTFRNAILLVNAGLIGTMHRLQQNSAEKNYALRTSWGTIDSLRGVMGRYYGRYGSIHGPNFVNLATVPLTVPGYTSLVENIPLELSYLPMAYNNLGADASRFLIELDNDAWNALAFNDETRDLLRKIIEEEGIREGNPYWKYFLKDGFPLETETFSLPPVVSTGVTILDHTSVYYRPPVSEAMKSAVGLNLKVEPIYNFYADTTPPYEEVTKSGSPTEQVTEPMLTNFYCLESEMRNTGSTFNSDDYYRQITLDTALQHVNIDGDPEADPWFVVDSAGGGMRESTTAQFYTLYSKGLETLMNAGVTVFGTGAAYMTFGEVKNIFETKYKNMVILNSDLRAMRDLSTREVMRGGGTKGAGTEGTRNLPFYNKIIIGNDHASIAGSRAAVVSTIGKPRSFLYSLTQNYGPALLDIMQLYIIENLLGVGSAEPAIPFKQRVITKTDPTNASVYSTAITDFSPTIYFDMDRFLTDIEGDTRIESIVNRINNNSTTSDNFILIRNYNAENGPVEATSLATDQFLTDHENGDINYPVRDYLEIIQNKSCYSEPIMYKIDKRVITANGATGSVVQTFFIGRPLDGAEISYVDSQVKYGVRYQYDISDIRIIFGNSYSYNDLKVAFTAVSGYGRAIGNALGFYRPTRPDLLLDDVIEDSVQKYTEDDEDTRVTSTAMVSPALSGYYIFKPTNPSTINVTDTTRQMYLDLAERGTHFVGGTPSVRVFSGAQDSSHILNTIQIQIEEGMGFEGNESGGAIPGTLTIVPGQTLASQPTSAIPAGGTGAAGRPAGAKAARPAKGTDGEEEDRGEEDENAPNLAQQGGFPWDQLLGN